MHAYLIIAHTNWEQLQQLISLLDDIRNDIYLHIDTKSKIDEFHFKSNFSRIYYVDREDVRWGDVGSVIAEMKLFEMASHHGYQYYHLISGMDLPLHNQDYIHSFFERNNGKEFIGFGRVDWKVKDRVYCYNLFSRQMRHPIKIFRFVFKFIRLLGNWIQKSFSFYLTCNKIKGIDYRYGCNWVSVTHDFVTALLQSKEIIISMYQHSYCADEIYKQTLAWNSRFKSNLFDIHDEFRGCMREIDWKRGTPYVYRSDDYEMLSGSKMIFARKFDDRIDSEILTRIINKIRHE